MSYLQNWTRLSTKEALRTVARLIGRTVSFEPQWRVVLDRTTLPFYKDCDLYRFQVVGGDSATPSNRNVYAFLQNQGAIGLSFGLTRADVELFVRGAARRARKAGRLINQADLVAEVTGKPRGDDGGRRLTPEEMRRVAVHEAGHALARCLSSSQELDINYISIVPRSNGALGFVASTPSDKVMITLKEFVERIEVALGGRAAEVIIFGDTQVSSGSGGESDSSDLAIATRIATSLVCVYGFGTSEKLRWSKDVTASQAQELN